MGDNNKVKIYFAHPMELDGQGLLDDSGRRARGVRELLGQGFAVWIPEEHQAGDHITQKKIDLDALKTCDIILADLYHFGMSINNSMILGLGTNREIGFVMGRNTASKKKVPILVINRKTKNFHCFDVEGSYEEYGITKNCNGIEEACEYIRKHYGTK